MDAKKTMKKAAAGTAMAGAFGFAMIGLGSGVSLAKPNHPGPNPPGPGVAGNPSPSWHGSPGTGAWNRTGDDDIWGGWNREGDENGIEDDAGVTGTWNATLAPGLNPFGPPGQVMHMPTLTIPGVGTLANPFYNVPPGQWRTVNPADLTWVPPNAPAGTAPMALTFNASTGQWGVTIDGTFYAYPIQFGAAATAGTS